MNFIMVCYSVHRVLVTRELRGSQYYLYFNYTQNYYWQNGESGQVESLFELVSVIKCVGHVGINPDQMCQAPVVEKKS